MLNCKQSNGDPVWESLKAQVARISGMKNFPREAAAIRELVLALQNADSIPQATAVIDGILSSATSEHTCPMPADIRRAVHTAKESKYYVQEFAESPAVVCSACSDTGCAGGLGEPWRWCDCAAGTKLRAESPDRVDKLNAMNTAKLPQPSTQRMRSTKAVAEILERV